MNKSILITGANNGIGKDAARQLALIDETEKIYLACRNKEKAEAAKKELEESTGREIFEIIIMDVSDPDSVRTAVASLSEPIDAIIMNAGGMGGKTPEKLTKDGVTTMFATNVLGHVVLLDELLKTNKLNNVALFSSSEAVRGFKQMGLKQPDMKTSSADEFATVMDGTFFGEKFDPMAAYGYTKYAATMWMASEARKNPNIRFISMSPGGTRGTSVMDNLTGIMRIMYKYVMMPIVMPLTGMNHKLEKGAKRYVDGINDETLKSGTFYGSKLKVLSGPIVDQSTLFADLNNTGFQDNANEAVHRFIHLN